MNKQIVYDLMPHWIFWREDIGGAITLEELERLTREGPAIRGQVIMGDPLRTKPARVLVSLSGDGLSLWDVRTRVSHRWAAKAPVDYAELAAALKKLGG